MVVVYLCSTCNATRNRIYSRLKINVFIFLGSACLLIMFSSVWLVFCANLFLILRLFFYFLVICCFVSLFSHSVFSRIFRAHVYVEIDLRIVCIILCFCHCNCSLFLWGFFLSSALLVAIASLVWCAHLFQTISDPFASCVNRVSCTSFFGYAIMACNDTANKTDILHEKKKEPRNTTVS